MSNEGVTPVDYTSLVGQVRALIGDTESIALDPPVAGQGEYMWYSDGALTGLLSVYGDNPLKAAAQGLRIVASSQALLLKKWNADDLGVDGAAIAEALRKLAADLDKQASEGIASIDIFEISDVRTDETTAFELFPYGDYSGYLASVDELEQDGGLLG